MSYHITRKTEEETSAAVYKALKSLYAPDENGYYGRFGGAYIPEMLHRNVEELRTRYLEIMAEAAFQKEYQQLLQDYVGRPTPLYFAERLSKQYGSQIWLKREDLCHTGAHKVNNTVGANSAGVASWQEAHHR
jgi:tryptophan synthase beta chain